MHIPSSSPPINGTVYLVDDEAAVRDALGFCLVRTGCTSAYTPMALRYSRR